MEEKGHSGERHHKHHEDRHHEHEEGRHHKGEGHGHHKGEGYGHHKGEGYGHHKGEGYGHRKGEGYGHRRGEGHGPREGEGYEGGGYEGEGYGRRSAGKYGYGKGGLGEGFLSKRNLWLMAGGAIGVLAFMGLRKSGKSMKPAAVGALKEGFAFKEWAAGKFDTLKEDLEDVVAEAVYDYQSERGAEADTAKREEELLQKIEQMVEAKLAGMQPEEKEA